ncbi:PEGA domain-containing protein [Candidatus Microgenomates bacterium]|nr:MAG: PEGA domain-containing protein [Candidatus Microgenomates bacterium]
MRKILFVLFPLILAVIVFSLFMIFFSSGSGKGALQVTSIPKSKVYLNGNLIGTTPLCKCEGANTLDEGEYSIKLIPTEGTYTSFEERIKISKSVLTVVDRTFGQGAMSEGSIINLTPLENKKSLELSIISFPDKAQVFIDSSPSGETPVLLKDLTESDHEVKIVKSGYKEKAIRIRTVLGYKLTVLAFTGVDPEVINKQASSSASIEDNKASVSASLSPKIIILQTPTGFLRVREQANIGSAEIGRVAPSGIFDLLEEEGSWYKIKLENGKEGWISSQYAKKQ